MNFNSITNELAITAYRGTLEILDDINLQFGMHPALRDELSSGDINDVSPVAEDPEDSVYKSIFFNQDSVCTIVEMYVQDDHSACSKSSVDIDVKVAF